MKQVVQATKGGKVEVVDAPTPSPGPNDVLVRTHATVISPGTERFATQLAQSSLLAKAKARPDLVRQVIDKARKDGVSSTVASVRSRLEDDLLLGYSGAGEIVEIGANVRGVRPGQLVATAGSGFASHAEFQVVPSTLLAAVPPSVTAEEAAFATIASIALHGFRLAEVEVGAKIVVVGLGLIGQLACRIAIAAGCDVVGIDVDSHATDRAAEHGVLALIESGDQTTDAILDWSRGRGADAILITAGTPGDSRIIKSTPARCRDRATVVAVGDIGLELDRNAFYHHELELKVARSYGPGRYDPTYEQWAVDYPIGHVRWTEGRNLEAALDLMASQRLDIADLISHRYPIADASQAYALLDDRDAQVVGVVLDYGFEQPSTPTPARTARPNVKAPGTIGVGVCGAGLFVRGTILPSLRSAGLTEILHVSSASGTSAARLAAREGIGRTSSGIDQLLDDDDVDLVVIASTHSSHAAMTVQALDAGKHVYVEKPLAITDDELSTIHEALARTEGYLHVGFNRRWAPMVSETQRRLTGTGPLQLHYRINAGPLPVGHWYADRREGGRLLGEVCHFIDTANAIIGRRPVTVHCTGPNEERHDSYTLLIGYEDGSAATISYAADAHRSTPKELCEVTGRGHTVVLDDYRKLVVDGKVVKDVETGKGHTESLRDLVDRMRSTDDTATRSALLTTDVALRALQSSLEGRSVSLA